MDFYGAKTPLRDLWHLGVFVEVPDFRFTILRTWNFGSYLQLLWYWLIMLLLLGTFRMLVFKNSRVLWQNLKPRKVFAKEGLMTMATRRPLLQDCCVLNTFEETALHFVSKYNQLGGSTHFPMHMCFDHDDTVSAPKVQPPEYLRWIVSLLNWHRRVLLGLEMFGAFSLNVAYGYCKYIWRCWVDTMACYSLRIVVRCQM